MAVYKRDPREDLKEALVVFDPTTIEKMLDDGEWRALQVILKNAEVLTEAHPVTQTSALGGTWARSMPEDADGWVIPMTNKGGQ